MHDEWRITTPLTSRSGRQAKQQRGGQLRLGSPAAAPCGTNCVGSGSAVQWLADFFSACNQARRASPAPGSPLQRRGYLAVLRANNCLVFSNLLSEQIVLRPAW